MPSSTKGVNETEADTSLSSEPKHIEQPKLNNIKSVTPLSPSNRKSSDESSSKNGNGNSSNGTNNLSGRGYSSGGSTPKEESIDVSTHSKSDNPKCLPHSSSVLGLDKMMEERAAGGDLTNNIVHMEVPFGKPIEEVYEGVHDGPVLGSGISGLVRLCSHKATGARYAVKCLDLGLVETEEKLQQLREEIAIMCQLDHPNIVRLEEVYESHSEIYLVQELCVGGELFDRLDEQPDYHYTEGQCARLVKQMLCAVRYIHSKGIIHRDLKLENFLFSSVDPDSELKMIDFGLSKHFKFGEVQNEAVGTPYTVAPEVIQGCYDERCDVWAIGVITFLLLSGDPPFGGCGGPETLFQVRSNILQGRFRFEPEEIWAHVSQEAKDFIRLLLVTDPNVRPTAHHCQKSPWLHGWANKDKMKNSNRLNANVVEALVNFKEYSDMRKLLCEVLSFTLMPDQITDLRKEFEKLDTDGSGEISISSLKTVLMQEAGAGSLGALGEDEVEDIFNAMRVRKTETKIHWHEFIAAGLSQCKVDERNLKLAFDRLDSNHQGFVTFDNIMDLMGRDGAENEDSMRAMWTESMAACNSTNARITYDDFVFLMKGQHRFCERSPSSPTEAGITTITVTPSMVPPMISSMAPAKSTTQSKSMELPSTSGPSLQTGGLDVLYECNSVSESTDEDNNENQNFIPGVTDHSGSYVRNSVASLPSSPTRYSESIDIDDVPLSMDMEDDFDQRISDSADIIMKVQQDIRRTPPQSPGICPPSPTSSLLLTGAAAVSPLTDFTRRRSKSVDDQDPTSLGEPHPKFTTDIRRALPLPEHTHDTKEIEKVIHDDSLTPLVVNRQLYRAHRKMRLAVVEASKRFEDQQMKRTKAELQAKQQNDSSARFGAGLVMRRGHKKEVSSETIRTLMMQRQRQHESQVNKAAIRSGRVKRSRKKTVSDMSAMLSAINPEDTASSIFAAEKAKSQKIRINDSNDTQTDLPLHDITKPEPTVPGVFRKTNDPFQAMGSSLMGLLNQHGRAQSLELCSIKQQSQNRVIEEPEELKKQGSAMKLSLSDGELNTKGTPDTPEDGLKPRETEESLGALPFPPLTL